MLKRNCKKGMKVTTTGNTIYAERSDSLSCIREERDGYITVQTVYNDYAVIGYIGTAGRFKYKQVHPYFGDKDE